MDTKLRDAFKGKVVNKKLTLNTGVDEFPRYVLEYLIDNYCSEETFAEDMAKVIGRLQGNFVYGAEAEKVRFRIRETRDHTVIASMEVRLLETEDKYWASIPAINEQFVNIPEEIVRTYPMLLSGGMWGTIELTYDENEVHGGKIRPFKVLSFTPFQVTVINPQEYIDKRRQFTAEEWLNVLVNSCGLNPASMTHRQKLLYVARCIPLVEQNVNLVELGPRETGKTYLYRNVSYYSHVLSGGKTTPAQLFINLNTGKVGEVGTRDAVIFDEIANTDFTDPRALVSIMQGYMQDAKFSRGKKEMLAFASLVFVGNIDVQGQLPDAKYSTLFDPLPEFLQVIAFLDRLHGYLPGWEIPKLTPTSYSEDYGFITDYFCEIMHELRTRDVLGPLKQRFAIMELAGTKQGVSGRDQRAVFKTLSGLLKLLYPDGTVTDDQLTEVALLACELRQRVRDQLHLMSPGEYEPVRLGIRLSVTGETLAPKLLEVERIHRIVVSPCPIIGEVNGLAVLDHGPGALMRFEMQATKGHGRLVPLGNMQQIMRESVEAAGQYVKAQHSMLKTSVDWPDNVDVVVLAIYMGQPKEGPSAGVAIVTGIVSALKQVPVRNDVAMTGEITILGKVLPIGGIVQKVFAAYAAGIREVILPRENLGELSALPEEVLKAMTLTPVDTVDEVLARALVLGGKSGSESET